LDEYFVAYHLTSFRDSPRCAFAPRQPAGDATLGFHFLVIPAFVRGIATAVQPLHCWRLSAAITAVNVIGNAFWVNLRGASVELRPEFPRQFRIATLTIPKPNFRSA
jgi:hypothetical protein